MFTFLNGLGYSAEAEIFRKQEIDGAALILIKRCDVIKEMGLKLGPAVKIFAHIERLQKYRPYVPETPPITPPASLAPGAANKASTIAQKTPETANRKSSVTQKTPETANRKSSVTQKTPEASGRKSIIIKKECLEDKSCEPKPKRRPGRPRKCPLPDAGTNNGEITSEGSPGVSKGTKRPLESELETPNKTEPLPKRNRGRPKKFLDYSP